MTDTDFKAADAPPASLPGAAVIRRIRALLLWAFGTALVYGALASASRGRCSGGYGDGGAVDAAGQPTSAVPMCVSLTLRPSSIVSLAIGAVVIVAISLVLRRATGEAQALRLLDRAAIALVVLTLAWAALTFVSFFSIPLDAWDGSEPFSLPFTFGDVRVELTPMPPTG